MSELNPFSIKELTMTEQAGFVAHEYTPDASYYIPDDEPEDDHQGWLDYCFEASHVDRQRVLECVLSSLDTDDSPLYGLIDSCLKDPPEPGRARESVTVLAAVGQSILNLIAKATDDQVNLRMAIGGTR
jgi:hypothetical protein